MSARTPKPIKTAQRVLFGLCPLADILRLGPEAMEPWAEWLFSPAAVLADLADPASYPRRSPALARRALAEAAGRLCRFWPSLPKVAWCIRPPPCPALYGRQRSWPPSSPVAGRSCQSK